MKILQVLWLQKKQSTMTLKKHFLDLAFRSVKTHGKLRADLTYHLIRDLLACNQIVKLLYNTEYRPIYTQPVLTHTTLAIILSFPALTLYYLTLTLSHPELTLSSTALTAIKFRNVLLQTSHWFDYEGKQTHIRRRETHQNNC